MAVPKTIKNFLNYFLGPLLFAALALSIYHQVTQQPHLAQSWIEIKGSFTSFKIFYLVAATVLIFFNWGLEARKWQLLIATVRPVNFFTAYKAVLSGVSFSVALPNRVGEYIGRMIYQPEGGRLKIVSLAIVGGIAQLLTTLLWGTVGLIILKKHLLLNYPQLVIWYQFVLYGLLFVFFFVSMFYFKVSSVVFFFSRWLRNHHLLYLVESLQNFNAVFLLRLAILSSLRYGVFLLQYIAVFHLFQVDVSAIIIMPVMGVVFLALALIPSIALLEVGLRGEVSLRLMGLFSANTLGIGLTSVTIWFINLILPALVGTLLLWNVKLLSKNEKK